MSQTVYALDHKCIRTINAKLAETDQQLSTNFGVRWFKNPNGTTGNMMHCYIPIPTERKDGSKRKKKTDVSIIPTFFCFCGLRLVEFKEGETNVTA